MGLCLTLLGQLVLVEPCKVYWIDEERRETTFTRHFCDNSAREREKKPWTVDHENRFHDLFRCCADVKDTRISKLNLKHRIFADMSPSDKFEYCFKDLILPLNRV